MNRLAVLRGRPSAEQLAFQLQDVADGLAAAFATLANDPHPAACEMLGIRLDGARRLVLLLGEALAGEVRA